MSSSPVTGDNNSSNLSTTIPKIEDIQTEVAYDHMADVVFKNRLDVWIDKLGNFVSYAFMVSVAISFYEIISRYFFDAPTIWVHETTIMICALCMAYGGAYCLARDSHIRIRVIYDVVGPKGKRILDIINGVLSVFYCLLIAYAAFILAEKALFNPLGEFRLETTGSAWDPIYPALVKTGLFLVLITMTLQSLLHLVQAIFRKQPEA
ncbi:MAG: TRAP transporter small permease [Reinekea forsetii]|jgi:TRAP-type C4-dicarboxylate transport system permease small subunit|uniref:TRAP transporter small permease protein n=1 Tax=Reinekea forsetii TaxID=1336806 RepID=A0A2K8KU65_9GAMM|nr:MULTISPECIES: TRAP transporter small permease [Reinekea]ATX77619.1 TRAP-type C4-dicarboxylate transport system, small permease component DctQ [Reinekea forsetii]MDO7673610.1 TRAP transporter small permease [Reinekea forsetii]